MTTVLIAILIPVGVLCLLNLALSLAVIRRLREHSDKLAALGGIFVGRDSGLAPGAAVPGLAAVTHDGAELPVDALAAGDRLLAFVSASCAACREHLPGFVAAAAAHGPDGTVVVVTGDPDRGADLVRMAAGAARVVVEADDGPWTSGYHITTFPTFFRLRDGVVAAKGLTVADIAQPLPV